MRVFLAVSAAVLGLSAAAFALVAVGSAEAQPSATKATMVKVIATDFHFRLSRTTVKPGRVTFVIHNSSPALHDFAIAGSQSKIIGPGKTTRLTVTLKPRRYLYECTVDSHKELGMKGYLRVQR